MLADFYQGKCVFITGCCGFKGSWLALALKELGARVCGVSLGETPNEIFCGLQKHQGIDWHKSTVQNRELLVHEIQRCAPDLVFHLAVSGFLQTAHKEPAEAFLTNVQGTVNLFEALRETGCAQSIVVATTDKVYAPQDTAYWEDNPLGNTQDIYSTTKSCVELVCEGYRNAYWNTPLSPRLAVVRCSNVIGAGDQIETRIIPTVLRSIAEGTPVTLTNPLACRSYLHVLDAVAGYLMVGKAAFENAQCGGGWNIGPDEDNILTTQEIVTRLLRAAHASNALVCRADQEIKQTGNLTLDSTKIRQQLGWRPVLTVDDAIGDILQYAGAQDPYVQAQHQTKRYFMNR